MRVDDRHCNQPSCTRATWSIDEVHERVVAPNMRKSRFCALGNSVVEPVAIPRNSRLPLGCCAFLGGGGRWSTTTHSANHTLVGLMLLGAPTIQREGGTGTQSMHTKLDCRHKHVSTTSFNENRRVQFEGGILAVAEDLWNRIFESLRESVGPQPVVRG